MFIELLLSILIGSFAGIITGLTPGVHVNLISVFVLGLSPILLKFFSLIDLCAFIVAMSITHVFVDMIPSIFLGAPEEDTALGVLPGHRFLLKGKGYMALKLGAIGAYFALVLSVILFPVMIYIVKFSYELIEQYVGYILLGIIIFMVIRDNKKIWALLILCISGILGIVVLNMPNLTDPLFPMFSGLFGIATLLLSLNESQNIPKQEINNNIEMENKNAVKALASGQFSGFLTALLPGIGASTAAVVALQIAKKIGDSGFMILMGAINMVNFVLSIGTLYIINKARNGTIVAVSEILGEIEIIDIFILLSVALISGGIAMFLAFKIGKIFADIMQKVNYKKLVIGVIVFVTILVFTFTGFIGILVLIISTAIGLLPAITKTTRTQAMGCLTIPVIMYYLI